MENRRLLLQIAVVTISLACGYYLFRSSITPRNEVSIAKGTSKKKRLVILYGTITGTAKEIAHKIARGLSNTFGSVLVKDMRDYDYEEYLHKEQHLVVVLSTYTDGSPPPSTVQFFQGIQDILHDFRYSKGTKTNYFKIYSKLLLDHLSKLRFAIIGLGGRVYGNKFCLPVLQIIAV